MIPVRDGIELHAVICRPTKQTQALPILLKRTPYGFPDQLPDPEKALPFELAQSGYIFVVEDSRGRFKSEGSFQLLQPLVDHTSKQSDESTDAYDTVAWLLRNVPNSVPKIGILGTSYDGFLAMMAGIDPHPAVKAISPQAPLIDGWMGDDFFHNGAFRQTYGYNYAVATESSKEITFSNLASDAYDVFLKAGSFEGATRSAPSDLPSWKAFRDHPSYDAFWQARAVERYLDHWSIPILIVGGWWDQEDMWGPQKVYSVLNRQKPDVKKILVIGPWNHDQWSQTTRKLGEIDFGRATGEEFRAEMEAPFFAYYLKGEAGLKLAEVNSFQSGSNLWQRYEHWPPASNVQSRNLYLGKDSLGFDKPVGSDETEYSTYVADPASPVPYRKRPIESTYTPKGSGWYTWLVQDQRFLGDRKDVVSWMTPTLDHDLTVTGEIIADLFASTSGTSSDWIVKLIDVYPDEEKSASLKNFQLMVAGEIFRGSYLKSFESPQPIPANQVLEYKFGLNSVDHVFLKGHRLMVQVQSSWFPLYDRNPQQYVPNIMIVKPNEYKAATQKVYWSERHPSHLEIPVQGINMTRQSSR